MMPKRARIAILAALILGSVALSEEPWSTTVNAPVFSASSATRDSVVLSDSDVATITCRIWLAFYQHALSVVSSSHCRMEPSCSNFSIQAIQKHGPIIGMMMTGDRLLHEADEQRMRRIVRSLGKAFCPDPVANNDFWWHQE